MEYAGTTDVDDDDLFRLHRTPRTSPRPRGRADAPRLCVHARTRAEWGGRSRCGTPAGSRCMSTESLSTWRADRAQADAASGSGPAWSLTIGTSSAVSVTSTTQFTCAEGRTMKNVRPSRMADSLLLSSSRSPQESMKLEPGEVQHHRGALVERCPHARLEQLDGPDVELAVSPDEQRFLERLDRNRQPRSQRRLESSTIEMGQCGASLFVACCLVRWRATWPDASCAVVRGPRAPLHAESLRVHHRHTRARCLTSCAILSSMPLQNRVTPSRRADRRPCPWPRLRQPGLPAHAEGRIRRLHDGRRWIACRLRFRGWHRSQLMQPGRFTELFFLDEATAFAAGHRPCALCRRGDHSRFLALTAEPGADAIDTRLHAERLDGRARRRHRRCLRSFPTARSCSATSSRGSCSALPCGAGRRPVTPIGCRAAASPPC